LKNVTTDEWGKVRKLFIARFAGSKMMLQYLRKKIKKKQKGVLWLLAFWVPHIHWRRIQV